MAHAPWIVDHALLGADWGDEASRKYRTLLVENPLKVTAVRPLAVCVPNLARAYATK